MAAVLLGVIVTCSVLRAELATLPVWTRPAMPSAHVLIRLVVIAMVYGWD